MFFNPFLPALLFMSATTTSLEIMAAMMRASATMPDVQPAQGKWEGNIYFPTAFGERHHHFSFTLAPVIAIRNKKPA